MIVFTCTCDYTWIVDIEAATLIGPIRVDETFNTPNTSSNKKTAKLFIGNKREEISMGAFRDTYSDCWHDLLRRLKN